MEYQCKQGQYMMIELIGEEPKAEELDSDYEGMETDEDIEAITHTVHALAGYTNPQTMKIRGTLKHKPVTMLIDTCSTNNFMDRKVVARLAYHIEGCDRFKVKITHGRILTSDSKGQEFFAMITTLKDRSIAYTVKKWRPYVLDQRVVMRCR